MTAALVLFIALTPAASGDEAPDGRDGSYQLTGLATVEGTGEVSVVVSDLPMLPPSKG